jgi:hypothetical protein
MLMPALLLASILAFLALGVIWMRVTSRERSNAQKKRTKSHLDWRAPEPSMRRRSGAMRRA